LGVQGNTPWFFSPISSGPGVVQHTEETIIRSVCETPVNNPFVKETKLYFLLITGYATRRPKINNRIPKAATENLKQKQHTRNSKLLVKTIKKSNMKKKKTP